MQPDFVDRSGSAPFHPPLSEAVDGLADVAQHDTRDTASSTALSHPSRSSDIERPAPAIGKLSIALPNLSPLGGGIPEAVRLYLSALRPDDVGKIIVHAVTSSLEQVDSAGWRDCKLDPNRHFGTARYFFSPSMLISLFRARPDIVHVHGLWQFQCAAVYLWSLVTGRPYVVSPHGMLDPWIRARSTTLKGVVSKLYQDRFLRRAAGFHLLTDKEKSDVAEFLNGQPASVIRNMAEVPKPDGAKPGWWQSAFEGKNLYLFLGRIHEKKGCMELIDAWEKMSLEDAEFKESSQLVFCGWNDGLKGFESRCASLKSTLGNVLFAGPQYGEEKTRSFAAAKYFILPSKSEGLPMAVLEAWAAGVPSIMSADCNLDIGFERGAAFRTGFKADEIYESLLAAKLTTAQQWSDASANAIQLMADEFSADSIRNGMLSLYESASEWHSRRSLGMRIRDTARRLRWAG